MRNWLRIISFFFLFLTVAFASRIAISQGSLALASLAWIVDVSRRRERDLRLPDFLYPLALYALFSTLAAIFSLDPAQSIPRLRESLLFIVVVLMVNLLTQQRGAETISHALLASGVILAIWGLAQYVAWSTDIRARIRGPISHYMTYSGIILLCTVVGIAYTICARRRLHRLGYGLATAVMVAALFCTRTRSAYLGLAGAVVVAVLLTVPRLLIWAPVVLVLILSIVPPPVFSRIRSITDPKNETNLARYYLWTGGIRMILDHPVLGVGQKMVKPVYMGTARSPNATGGPYRNPDTPTKSDAHLHNNVLQVAAERGLPALAAWLALFGTMAARAWRTWKRDRRSPLSISALLGLAAFHVAGLFEYNFGDSEVLLCLLVVAGLAYVQEGLLANGDDPVPTSSPSPAMALAPS